MESAAGNDEINSQVDQFSVNLEPVSNIKRKKKYIGDFHKEASNVETSMMSYQQRNRLKKFLEPLDIRRRKSLYVGNLDSAVCEDLLHEIFSSFAPVVHVQIHRGDVSTYAFIQFESEEIARAALDIMNGAFCRGRPMRVRWSEMSGAPQPSTKTLSSCFNVYAGNLSSETTSEALKTIMSAYGEIVEAKVLPIQPATKGLSFAFIHFRLKLDAEKVIHEVREIWIDKRSVRFSWAHSRNTTEWEHQEEEGNGDGTWPYHYQEPLNYWNILGSGGSSTSVYIGNLPPIYSKSDTVAKLEQRFSQFGKLLSIKVFPGKLYAFVEFASKQDAANAIVASHSTMFEGRRMKCFWGRGLNNNGNVENPEENYAPAFAESHVYDPNYINAPLQQENLLPNPNINANYYYNGGFPNAVSGAEFSEDTIQQAPYYQPEPCSMYYTVSMTQLPQQGWFPGQGTEDMWIPAEAPMYSGVQEYSVDMSMQPCPDGQFWYPPDAAFNVGANIYPNEVYDFPLADNVDHRNVQNEVEGIEQRFESLEIRNVQEEEIVGTENGPEN